MIRYVYSGMDGTGHARKGIVEARDKKHAVAILQTKGLFPLSVDVPGRITALFGFKSLANDLPDYEPENPGKFAEREDEELGEEVQDGLRLNADGGQCRLLGLERNLSGSINVLYEDGQGYVVFSEDRPLTATSCIRAKIPFELVCAATIRGRCWWTRLTVQCTNGHAYEFSGDVREVYEILQYVEWGMMSKC